MSEVSEKQLEANKVNSKLGGVKTDEGKQISKMNAVKHGIFSTEISDYEDSDISAIKQYIQDELKPVGLEQNMLANRILGYMIRLIRINKAEMEFMKSVLDPDVELDMNWSRTKGYQATMNSEHVQTLNDTYLRYQITVENRLDKAMTTLKRMKKDEL